MDVAVQVVLAKKRTLSWKKEVRCNCTERRQIDGKEGGRGKEGEKERDRPKSAKGQASTTNRQFKRYFFKMILAICALFRLFQSNCEPPHKSGMIACTAFLLGSVTDGYILYRKPFFLSSYFLTYSNLARYIICYVYASWEATRQRPLPVTFSTGVSVRPCRLVSTRLTKVEKRSEWAQTCSEQPTNRTQTVRSTTVPGLLKLQSI